MRVNGGSHQCGENGWYGEETLDVEAVHAAAQGAKIRYYGAASCFDADFLDTFAMINDEDAAQFVINSWDGFEVGQKASTTAAYEQAFLQGAAEGISYMFSWNPLDFLYGSGGGSLLFAQPAYKAGVTPAGARGVPDVAMDADPTTGMLVGETQTLPEGVHYGQYRIGGTSLASPLFAGMTALALQHGGGVGLLNPTIYAQRRHRRLHRCQRAGTGCRPRARRLSQQPRRVGWPLYSVRTFDQDSSLAVAPGWDDGTGLGSPTRTG